MSQSSIEQVGIIEKGKNYGWNIMEGSECFKPPVNCDERSLILPLWEYSHDVGQSVTGGASIEAPTFLSSWGGTCTPISLLVEFGHFNMMV